VSRSTAQRRRGNGGSPNSPNQNDPKQQNKNGQDAAHDKHDCGQGSGVPTQSVPQTSGAVADVPPKSLAEGALRVVALGGVGEVGRNMTVFEYGGRLLVVDCGVLFPSEESPGVDLILPDFRTIEDRLDDIDALVLTHGHEDHIGAVPFLLRQKPDLLVVGSRFTLALVEAKCKEHRLTPHLLEVREGERNHFGTFDCEFFAVNHSIPDALAVAIRTPGGTVLHTGDIKLDQLPLDGRLTDLAGFSRLGDEGVDLLLVDSTNAEVPGFVTPERDIAPVIDDVFRRAPSRLIVACFASHVHRVQQVLNAAATHKRKVCFTGRSMVRNMGIAADLGLLDIPEGLLVDLDDALQMPEKDVVLVSTGSQGEPLSALGRMARGDHRQITITPGDTVVLLSSLIPGNETAVFAVINGLTRLGAEVVHSGVAKVHVSGHASAGELLFLYNALRPRNVMPVHGEWRHLRANAEIAKRVGIPAGNVVIAEDGVVVDVVDKQAAIAGRVEVGHVYVDGNQVGDVGETTLSDRLMLGEGGFISITVAVEAATGRAVAPPRISGRGFSDDPKALENVVSLVEMELARTEAEGITDTHRIAQSVRRVVGKWVGETYRRRPMIVPTVLPV
jgi:ribonuclease J